MTDSRPLIGISVGDPAGIGPEVTIKALADATLYEQARPLAVCDARVMHDALRFSGPKLRLHPIDTPAAGLYEPGTLDVLNMPNVDMANFRYQQISAMCGDASFQYVRKVIELAMSGEIDATVTGPIHKEALHLAGHKYAGHTEIYGDLTGTRDYAMMLADGGFRVVHVSTHVSLREAINRVKKERVLRVIQLAHDGLRRFGIAEPRLAVAGLNPHAGEGGLFGREEIEEIIPAIEAARADGLNVEGPFPGDTIFSKLRGGQYDIVVVMYHDQGHIPTKLMGFQFDQATDTWTALSGINVTLGLPIIRVSVDHGVAFDKAGEGRANPESMHQAITSAIMLAKTKDSVAT